MAVVQYYFILFLIKAKGEYVEYSNYIKERIFCISIFFTKCLHTFSIVVEKESCWK